MKVTKVFSANAKVSGNSRLRPSPAQWSALASLHRDVETKKDARHILQCNRIAGSQDNVNALFERIYSIQQAHENRHRLHVYKRLGFVPAEFDAHKPRAALLKNRQEIEKLLISARKKEVQDTAKYCLRHGAAGGSSFSISLTRNPQDVDYRVKMDSNRHTYRGRYKGYSAREDHHHICVPFDWSTRVKGRNLEDAGGMMTLDVQPLQSHGDVELFQAVWVAQSIGYEVTVQRGVIARLGEEVYHGNDAQKAIRGVLRKVKQASLPRAQKVSAYALSVDAFIERYSRVKNVLVDVNDARQTGACEYGIKSWCNTVGIDLDLKAVPLARILEGFRMQPQEEVRRTVLQALKRHRAAIRLEAVQTSK